MDIRVARNALNFFLSDRFTFSGEDFLPLTEVIRELQYEVAHGAEGDTSSGPPEGQAPGS